MSLEFEGWSPAHSEVANLSAAGVGVWGRDVLGAYDWSVEVGFRRMLCELLRGIYENLRQNIGRVIARSSSCRRCVGRACAVFTAVPRSAALVLAGLWHWRARRRGSFCSRRRWRAAERCGRVSVWLSGEHRPAVKQRDGRRKSRCCLTRPSWGPAHDDNIRNFDYAARRIHAGLYDKTLT